MFDIYYGMKELHSRDGMAEGQTLVVSPTESYNDTDGWLEFDTAIEPGFVTVAQTGSIGEAFVQLEPCAVNDDCLVLLPKIPDVGVARLVIAAAVLHAEKWRFNYGEEVDTPQNCWIQIARFASIGEVGRDKVVEYEGSYSCQFSSLLGYRRCFWLVYS